MDLCMYGSLCVQISVCMELYVYGVLGEYISV